MSTFRGLRPATSVENYIENPIGRYRAGTNAAAFWATSVLTGISFWGYPNDADVELITGALHAAAAPRGCCHASLVDLRRLERLDLRVFDRLCSNLASHFTALGSLVTRRALIVPRGPTGAIVADLFKSSSRDASVRSFVDGVEALVWIEFGDHSLLEELDRLSRIISNRNSMIQEVRGLLDQGPAAQAEEVARRFGMSRRTFQRRLFALGTSFQQEVTAAHLRIAKRLMRETESPLKCIAIESGYASLQHFSSSFRAHVGVSPSRWRANEE